MFDYIFCVHSFTGSYRICFVCLILLFFFILSVELSIFYCLLTFAKEDLEFSERPLSNALAAVCVLKTPITIHQLNRGFKPHWGFPGGSVVKNLPASAGDIGDTGSIPGSGRSPGEGNGNPLQYSYLENPMDRGAWWATVLGVSQSEHAQTQVEIKAQMEGFLPLPASQHFQTLLLKPKGNSFSGLLMSSASDQKFFCAVC